MNELLALAIAENMLKELNAANHYTLKFRHLNLKPSELIHFSSSNQFIVIIQISNDVQVESNRGICHLINDQIAEQQYTHKGAIRIQNLSEYNTAPIRFLQVITQNRKT